MIERIRRILIVDDEIEFGKAIQRQLKRSGFFSECAVNGRHAYYKIQNSFLENKPFNLVITDLIMPHMDGNELVTKIISNYPMISIIVMSGYSEIENLKKYLRFGMDSFCHKPFTPDEILNLVLSIDASRAKRANKIT